MKTGKITAKLRDAVPVCLMVNGEEVKRYKNIELPDELKEVEMTDFHFNVHMDGKITFEIHYEEGALPEIFPEARTRVSRAAKAAAKAAAQESTEVMAVEAAEPEIETALQESPQTDEIPAEDPGEPITVGNEPEGIEAAYNVTGVRRKELVAAVGDFIGAKPEYLRAVSYTHLDVYKRQMSSKAESVAALTCSTAAVSSFPRKPPVSWDSRSSRVRMLVAVTSPPASSA